MHSVSVVIPSYNHERFLNQRLVSIVEQTYPVSEIIVIDDCSEDGSWEVICGFAANDSRFKCIQNSENSGSPFVQWNRGVELAEGSLVWIAESDDVARSDFLERLVAKFDERSDLVLAWCQSRRICEDGRESDLILTGNGDLWERDFVCRGSDAIDAHIGCFCSIPNISSALFRRDAYLASGGADLSFRMAADWKLYLKMFSSSRPVAFLASDLNLHRSHPATVRQVHSSDGWALSEVFDVIFWAKQSGRISGKVFSRTRDFWFRAWLVNHRPQLGFSGNLRVSKSASMVSRTRAIMGLIVCVFIPRFRLQSLITLLRILLLKRPE